MTLYIKGVILWDKLAESPLTVEGQKTNKGKQGLMGRFWEAGVAFVPLHYDILRLTLP